MQQKLESELRGVGITKARLAGGPGLLDEPDRLRLLGKLLRAEEVAELLGVKLSTVRAWTRRRDIPCVKIGPRGVRYRLLHILAFVDARSCPALRTALPKMNEILDREGHGNILSPPNGPGAGVAHPS